LIVPEHRSAEMSTLVGQDRNMTVWWATIIECAGAIARQERERTIDVEGCGLALTALERLRSDWNEVPPSGSLRDLALRLLRSHPLRASDALQLAAALIAAEEAPATLDFVCLDDRLALAATREGFNVIP
jgi:uncharacterized protein